MPLKLIKKGKKKKIRKMRGKSFMINPDGSRSSHKMAWVGDPSKKRGNFGVFPTIAPKKGKENSTSPKDWLIQTAKQAQAKGEFIKVRSRKRAKKLASGAWKKKKDR